MVERRHEVKVYCASQPEAPGTQTVEGIKVHRLWAPIWLYAVPLAPKLPLELMKEKADVIHANFPNPYNASLAGLKALIQKTPSVITWHNDIPSITKASKALVLFHDCFLAPIYLTWFNKIIATSKFYFETSRILQKLKDKVAIIPNGVDCEKFNPSVEGEKVRARYGLKGFKIVLFVGALTKWHRYKGLDILLKAFKHVNEKHPYTRLLVVGDGHLKTEYQRQADSLGLSSRVIFAGNVSDGDLPKYYAASDMLILPSKDRSEGFGLTILEANASGKPAIGSNVGGVPSVIKNGVNGLLVPPCDEKSLAAAVPMALKTRYQLPWLDTLKATAIPFAAAATCLLIKTPWMLGVPLTLLSTLLYPKLGLITRTDVA
ncbi:MAG: glycosyltransferase, partial [Candidatus Bathyarchaeia archaeon]